MIQLLETFAAVLAQLAPFLLLGFALAGLLHAFVPASLMVRAMGGTGVGPVVRAALIGIPLPLCSCGVIPVAVELRRRGAGRGATTAFLISTPETGVDSIAASWAVLHPLMVLARPLGALLTAIVTGIAVERWTKGPAAAPPPAPSCCHSGAEDARALRGKGLAGGLRYAFVDLFGETSTYLIPAVLVTALLTALLGPGVVAEHLPSRLGQMLLLLAASIPVYVCASAATPIAAGMIAAGFSPGAALVFLLAGPATNLVTVAAAAKTLGRSGAAAYVLGVAAVSLLAGAALDLAHDTLAIVPTVKVGAASHEHLTVLHWGSAAAVFGLVLWHLQRKLRKGRG